MDERKLQRQPIMAKSEDTKSIDEQISKVMKANL